MEAELTELAVELAGERLAEMHALLGEEIDVALGLTEAVIVESCELFSDLRFGFDRTPSHSRDAIGLPRSAVPNAASTASRV